MALAEALEMSEHLDDLQGDVKILLERWKKEMSSMSIPARPSLMHTLASIGMHKLQRKYIFVSVTWLILFTLVFKTDC